MTDEWEAHVADFWASADETSPSEVLAGMRRLVAERAEGDPDALYEWASVHDFLGREHDAIPLYEAALRGGLAGDRKPQALIQLASSLRNVGRPDEAARLLRDKEEDAVTGDAAAAFLALALHDSGAHEEALRTALLALSRTLPLYSGAVARYAEELRDTAS